VLALLAKLVEFIVGVVLVVDLLLHFISVLVKLALVLVVFVADVLVHLVEVGPGFLGLAIARLLQRLAPVQPVRFVTHHAVVLIRRVLIHLVFLVGGVRLDFFVVGLAGSVRNVVVLLLLLAGAGEGLDSRVVELGELVLRVLGLLLAVLVECLFAGVFLALLNDLLDAGFLLDFELALSDVLVAFHALSLVLAEFAAQVHLVVGLVGHEHLVLGARLHVHVPVGAEAHQIRRDHRVLHRLLLILEDVLADAGVRLRQHERLGLEGLLLVLAHRVEQVVLRQEEVAGHLEGAAERRL